MFFVLFLAGVGPLPWAKNQRNRAEKDACDIAADWILKDSYDTSINVFLLCFLHNAGVESPYLHVIDMEFC